ncbi:MAG TPA: Calx-beta domain-containing protein [Pyrinomonadaceae bacterium]|jgi:Calx-beta domain.|nr:Calx-beta domain-containing protein [Pyrinomonadaceae bacterium]
MTPTQRLRLTTLFTIIALSFLCNLNYVSSAQITHDSNAAPLAPTNFTQQTRLTSGNVADSYASLGVGISGNTAVVASNDGVYVYVRSGTTWSQQALLIPSDGLSGFGFPKRIAIDGDTVVLGCSQATINGIKQGAAYVFVRNGTTWTEQQRLTSGDALANDNFGWSVGISVNSIIVTAPTHQVGANVEQGAAYVFVRSGTVWSEQARILAEDGDLRNNFGLATSIDGDTAVVTRDRRFNAAVVNPAVYVFVRNGTTWQQQQRLSLCEPSTLDLCAYGRSVAVKSDTLIVGSQYVNEGSNDAQGAAYVYSRTGTTWTQQQKLTASDGLNHDYFGSELGISGQTLIVGAPADLGVPGKSYIYNWSGTEWMFQQKLMVGQTRNAFGGNVDISGSSIIIAASLDAGTSGSFIGAAYVFADESATPTPTPTPTPPIIQLNSNSIQFDEASGSGLITVTRTGSITSPSSVDYSTSDDPLAMQLCSSVNGKASSRCDYSTTVGTLTFAIGETSKTISIPITDDVYSEGPETFTITLSNPTGATLGSPATATITINDNDAGKGTNPIDTASFFVRQHYVDFLNREPDANGLAFWTNEITSCGSDAQCTEVKRINVSAAFFLSIEFQETGYLVYRVYKSAFGNIPQTQVPVRFTNFLKDTQQIGKGVQVGIGDWQNQLEANKQAFALAFVQRTDFQTAFPNTLTAQQFVDQLNTNAGSVLSSSENGALVAVLGATPSDLAKRAVVLRSVAEDPDLRSAELNKAFVLMQYFGYLRRNPNDPPDSDFSGLDFWFNKLNSFGGNFINAEMVRSFIVSAEYRQRFGP